MRLDLIRSLPKVALHDHLDGGLRPQTVLDLCLEHGLAPPGDRNDDPVASGPASPPAASTAPPAAGTTPQAGAASTAPQAGASATTPPAASAAASPTAQDVADWFHAAADSGSLPAYLSTFDRTLAVMQTAPDLRRIAREFVEDMVADGVVYAETRWAPHQHTAGGLTLDQAVQAVQDGIDDGVAAADAAGMRIVVGQLLAYLRQNEPGDDLVEIAIARRDRGVVGLDLAGPEAGFPAARFRRQVERARRVGVPATIHAGEADGPASIADALDCGAERLGHGVRIIEDIDGDTLGPTAKRVRGEQIALEVCPSSNLQTGAATSIAGHPVGPLYEHRFALAVSSDNRLMSRTDTSRELWLAAEAFDWTLADLERITLTALDAGFAPAEVRRALREEFMIPAFRAARNT